MPKDEDDEMEVEDDQPHKTKAELDKQRTTMNTEIEEDMAERVKKRLAFIERQTDLLLHFDPKVIPVCLSTSSLPSLSRIHGSGSGGALPAGGQRRLAPQLLRASATLLRHVHVHRHAFFCV